MPHDDKTVAVVLESINKDRIIVPIIVMTMNVLGISSADAREHVYRTDRTDKNLGIHYRECVLKTCSVKEADALRERLRGYGAQVRMDPLPTPPGDET